MILCIAFLAYPCSICSALWHLPWRDRSTTSILTHVFIAVNNVWKKWCQYPLLDIWVRLKMMAWQTYTFTWASHARKHLRHWNKWASGAVHIFITCTCSVRYPDIIKERKLYVVDRKCENSGHSWFCAPSYAQVIKTSVRLAKCTVHKSPKKSHSHRAHLNKTATKEMLMENITIGLLFTWSNEFP